MVELRKQVRVFVYMVRTSYRWRSHVITDRNTKREVFYDDGVDSNTAQLMFNAKVLTFGEFFTRRYALAVYATRANDPVCISSPRRGSEPTRVKPPSSTVMIWSRPSYIGT
jgi:hypothetical protein